MSRGPETQPERRVKLRRWGADKSRYHLWPIGLGLLPKLVPFGTFSSHGWQTHCEDVPVEQTSRGCVPGKRAVFGQTLTLGFFQIYFGPRPRNVGRP